MAGSRAQPQQCSQHNGLTLLLCCYTHTQATLKCSTMLTTAMAATHSHVALLGAPYAACDAPVHSQAVPANCTGCRTTAKLTRGFIHTRATWGHLRALLARQPMPRQNKTIQTGLRVGSCIMQSVMTGQVNPAQAPCCVQGLG